MANPRVEAVVFFGFLFVCLFVLRAFIDMGHISAPFANDIEIFMGN